jgi:seryl-tRNA synthetase
MMLDIKEIREQPDIFRDSFKRMKKKELLAKFEKVILQDIKLREMKVNLDKLRSSRNTLSQEVSKFKKEGKDVSNILKEVKELPNKIKKAEEKYEKIDKEINFCLSSLPNILHHTVKYGKDDSDNVEIKKWGTIPKFDFQVKNHVEILEELGLVDFEASAKAAGTGFYYLKGDLALLNQALIQYVIDFMNKKKYTYIEVPLMLWKEVLAAGIDVDNFKASIYEVEGEGKAMIGTSEFALLAMHQDQIMDVEKLPKKYFSYSMCFRKEIGAHGINEKGLWRTHQFNKVEQFIFCRRENSDDFYTELLQNSEEIFQALELPYRVIELCTGDMAVWKHRSGDIEVWRPTTESYGEVTSVSNCTDYQARKLKIRYKDGDKKSIVHTLNNTAIATSRALVTIVENYQQKDGSVIIPKVLQPYMNGKKKLTKLS